MSVMHKMIRKGSHAIPQQEYISTAAISQTLA